MCLWKQYVGKSSCHLTMPFTYFFQAEHFNFCRIYVWAEVVPGKISCPWFCCFLVKVHSWHHNSGTDAKSLKWHTPSKSLIASCSVPWFSNLLAWQRWRWPWSPPRILHILAFTRSWFSGITEGTAMSE